MRFRPRAISGALFTLVLALHPGVAHAQDEGGGDTGGDAGGDVFGEAYAEAPEPEEAEGPEHEDEQQEGHPDNIFWTLGGGGQLGYGNARQAAVNATSTLSIRRGDDVAVIEASILYGAAQSPLSCGSVQEDPAAFAPGTVTYCGPVGTGMSPRARAPGFNDWADTILNLNWRLRYDHFTDPVNAFFIGHRGRVDRFAGIQPRLGLQLGYSRLLLDEARHTFALDLGVDGTFDIYTDPIRFQTGAIVASGTTLPPLSGTDARFVPSVRVAFAYTNHLNAFLTYDTTFEALWDVVSPTHFRFEWVNKLRSAIDDTFSIELNVTFRLDSLPPGQARAWIEDPSVQTTTMFEVISTVKLQGVMDLDGTPPHSSVVGEDSPEEADAEGEAEEAHREIVEDRAEESEEDDAPTTQPTTTPTEPWPPPTQPPPT